MLRRWCAGAGRAGSGGRAREGLGQWPARGWGAVKQGKSALVVAGCESDEGEGNGGGVWREREKKIKMV
ncbi:hypothetical protein ACOSQ3_004817 [Xanthoceras sorbifolium]